MQSSATKVKDWGSKGRSRKNIPAQQLLEEECDDISDFEEEMENSVPVLGANGSIDFVHPEDYAEGDYVGAPTEDAPQIAVSSENTREENAPPIQQAEASPAGTSEVKSHPIGTPVSSLRLPDVGPEGLVYLPPGVAVSQQGPTPSVYIGNSATLPSPHDEPEAIRIDECAFEFRAGFLYCDRPKKVEIKLSAVFEIRNLVVDEAGTPFAVLVNIPAAHGTRGVVIKLIDLATNDKEAIRSLVLNGLWISPHPDTKNLLARFISHISRDAPRIRGTYKTGFQWFDDKAYFVLPGRTIPESPESPVFIQDGALAAEHGYKPTSDLTTWQNRIGVYCRGNPFLIFAICIALVSPWLRHFNSQGTGFHFWGRSSTGKSTIAYVIVSIILGRFEDFYRNWNATANGMEVVCKMCNGNCLVLDELGESSPKDADRAIYMISNGRPKKRYTDVDASQAQWQIMYASTGEFSSKAHLERGRITQKPGQAIRLMDIPIETEDGMGVFHAVPVGMSPAAFSQYLRDESRQHRGAVQEAYLKNMTHDFPVAQAFVADQMNAFMKICPSDQEGQVQRAHQMFALCAAAGEFGILRGILPWNAGDARAAACYVFEIWRSSFYENSMPESERIMERLHSTLLRHGESGFLLPEVQRDRQPRKRFWLPPRRF